MPFKFIGCLIKSIASLGENAQGFNAFDLKEAKATWGFDPKGFFTTHAVSVGYSNCFLEAKDCKEGASNNEHGDLNVKGGTLADAQRVKMKSSILLDDMNTLVSLNT